MRSAFSPDIVAVAVALERWLGTCCLFVVWPYIVAISILR